MSDDVEKSDERNEKKGPSELAGAYALDALGAEERAEFDEYLAGSEQGREQAAQLTDAAVALGLATAPVQPSAALKSSLMAKLASTPQLSREQATSGSGEGLQPPERTAPSVAPPVKSSVASPVGPPMTPPVAPPVTTDAPKPAPGSAESRARSRWFARPVTILVAAAAALALFAGGVLTGQAFSTGQFEQQQASSLAAIAAATDSQRASTTTADGHPATLVWSVQLGKSALLVKDLPRLPDDKDYQLWYMNDAGAFSAGTFKSSGSGTLWQVLQGTMKAGDTVGVTVEPKGGSKKPTTKPIVAIAS
jgi:anti-sigma-K factor RskA